MGELGSLSEDEHRNLGRLVADIKPRLVCWKGGHLEEFEDGLHAGRYGGAFCPVTSAEDMFKGLAACDLGSGGGVILFKGSRSNKLETLVSAFTEAQAGEPHAV
ncbi:MAG: UDP-N-acetylmuramoylalanyl-D-glutamyl-2, 6-diaminopimelate--D-alanyl-D-alanine ligase, partial [Bilophila wadsworthia]|jgi:UDP-N-acetylmuramoyl-tripeptide--D-alanyl-D-alanine ligase